VERTVLSAYAEGVRAAGRELSRTDLTTAYSGTNLLRGGFTSLPYEWLDDPARAEAFGGRMSLTHFILDTADRYLWGPRRDVRFKPFSVDTHPKRLWTVAERHFTL